MQVSPACSWPGLTKKVFSAAQGEPTIYRPAKKITFCRVCPHDASQAPLAADFAAEELKIKTVYVLDDKEVYGGNIAKEFKKRCEELKIKVLGHESINVEQLDYKALMKKIKEKGPGLVYFGGTTQSNAGQIARDMLSEKVDCPLMLPDGCYERAFIDSAGVDTLDTLKCFVTIGGVEPTELKGAGADFVKRYQQKHGKEPEPYAVYGYEAAAVVLEALQEVGKKDREAVRKAVVSTKDYTSLLGKWSFDADGDTTLQQVTISTIENGMFKPTKVMGTK